MELIENDDHRDAECEVRGSGVPTGLPCDYSRHYESKAVAAEMLDGSWVGWTYWYGGGKHSDPGSVPWMEDAYDVTMREETRVVRVFAKDDAAQTDGVMVGDGHGYDANTGVTHGTGEEG